jgi:uncharacterized protein (TIGR00661 family)
MKILYAAGNHINSKIVLMRFLEAIENKNYNLRIAAYRKSTPPGVNIDWTLDALLDIGNPATLYLDNDNTAVYFSQIKSFKPNLIISDLEYFTSYIANELNIPLWQCSCSMLNFAVTHKDKYKSGTWSIYDGLLNKSDPNTSKILNIMNNSNHNFVYSHFGDAIFPPDIKPEFEWIRPYHYIGKKYKPCEHNIVAATMNNNKQIIHTLKNYEDSVIFLQYPNEIHNNIIMKNINNFQEYACNLFNSRLAMCEGQTSFLADAFYNNRYSVIQTNFNEPECLQNSLFTQHLGFGTMIFNHNEDLNPYLDMSIKYSYKSDIKYLHEKIEEIYN